MKDSFCRNSRHVFPFLDQWPEAQLYVGVDRWNRHGDGQTLLGQGEHVLGQGEHVLGQGEHPLGKVSMF